MKRRSFSIEVKFTIVAVLISLISFGIAASLSNRWVREDYQKNYEEKATLIGTHILHDLSEAMVLNQHERMPPTLDFYRKYEGMVEVRLFDSKGQEVFTGEKGPREPRVEESLRTGRMIHYHKEIGEREVAAFIIPLENKTECQSCHGRSETRRGAVLVSLNQVEMKQNIARQNKRFLILFVVLALAIVGASVITVNRLLLIPLKRLQTGAEAIEKGDFDCQIAVKSKDEIGGLTAHFNHMAQRLKEVFGELEAKNKQLTEQFALVTRSQKEWQETFDCITDSIAVIDTDCKIVKVNKAFKATFGDYFVVSQDDMDNKRCNELFGACLLPTDCPHKTSTQDRRPVTKEIHGERTGKIFEASLFPHYALEAGFIGSVAIIKDVTEKKENEMRLIMNERLAALGQIVSGIAHEINNPLATIAVCSEGLLNRIKKGKMEGPFFEDYLKTIQEETDRCRNIVTGMLSFVRKKTNDKRGIDINEVLEKALQMLNLQSRLREVVVHKDFQAGIPVVLGNDGELMQVFLSIVVNALDAMEDKGTLVLKTGTEDNAVLIRISDTGPGIPSKLLNKIFDPFFTTKSEKGGTGLGLSIASKIIRDNDGRIDVTSEEGKGTTFTIILPT